MTQEHPITPPPELVRQWMERTEYDEHTWFYESYIAEQAARWGADQQLQLDAEQINQAWQKGADNELKACCDWLNFHSAAAYASDLRTARRPKPLSLKKQALAELNLLKADATTHGLGFDADTIRRALESLPD